MKAEAAHTRNDVTFDVTCSFIPSLRRRISRTRLHVIPVIDVLNGIAVHAKRGLRERYEPLRSVLCSSFDPFAIASTFKSFGFKHLYLADLDAILGRQPNYMLYDKIKSIDIELMIDAGISNMKRAEIVFEYGASKIVIGTETLYDLSFVNESIKSFGEGRVIVSLDLKEGKLLSSSEEIRSMNPPHLALELEKIGVATVIILDLARVGTECGVDKSIIGEILDKTELEVLVGGGISGMLEIKELKDMGVFGVLVSTILHNGKLKIEELKATGLL